MIPIDAVGNRPVFPVLDNGVVTETDLSYCPGAGIDATRQAGTAPLTRAQHEFGPVLEIWEGYACDEEVRRRGSSGGVLTALSMFSLERRGAEMVLHTGRDPQVPWANRTVTSRNRLELLGHTGSRYAPSSPCEGLSDIVGGKGRSVFVGKPCDVAAVTALRGSRPELDSKLDLVLTFFCAGTPASSGAQTLIKQLGSDPTEVSHLDYRGDGWPGMFSLVKRDGDRNELTYEESWSRLTGYRPLRCNLCPDGLGRLSDIACGDAWHRYSNDGNPGKSIILVRTERGRQVLAEARAAGYVYLERSNEQAVFDAQPGLLQRRREIFGRLLALRLLGIPVPQFRGLSLRKSWLQQPIRRQLRTIVGTLRRGIQRSWWRRNSEPSY